MAALFAGASPARAQTPILDEVHTLAGGEQPVEPLEKTLTIQTAGSYDLVLTDLQQPAPLAAVSLAVTKGTTVVTTASAAGTFHFDASPGDYVVRVVGALTSGKRTGAVGVLIKSAASGTTALEFVSPLQVTAGLASPDLSVLETDISIANAGDYEVSLTDLELPIALSSLQLSVTPAGDSAVLLTLNQAGVATFTAQPGSYHVVAIGQADASIHGGLFSVKIRSVATQAILLNEVEPVANVIELTDATLGAGSRVLSLTDFAFPVALSRSGVVVEQDGAALARLAASGTTNFVSPGGQCKIFVLATPATPPGTGAYGVDIRPPGGATEFAVVRTADGGVGAAPAFSFTVDIPAAGSYQLKLADFQFPTAFAALSIAAVQDGVVIGSASSAGTLNASLTAGRANVFVIAQLQAGAASLFGLSVTPAAGGSSILETTQGVGRAFRSRTLPISTAGKYYAEVVDMRFPVAFTDLAAVVTRGSEKFGSIVSTGKFSFDATPGDYIVSFLAGPAAIQAGSKQSAGTYGLLVANAPPAPVVTLTASAASVVRGQTAKLDWSSQNASSCTASSGWTGSRPLSGNETTTALSGPTTFTLECSGDFEKTSKSVTVDVTAAQEKKHGGGGRLDLFTLALLLAAGSLQWMSRNRERFNS